MSVKIKKIQQFYENYRFETLRANEQFQNIVLESSTLVSQIIVLHSLLISKKIPACTSLFQSAQLLIFENFPTCTFILACTFVWKRKKSYLFINKFWILPLFQVNFRMLQVHQMFLQGSFKKAINFSPCMVIPSCKTNNFCKFSSLHIYSSLHI